MERTMTEVSKEERRLAGVAAVRELYALESDFSSKMRVPASASKEDKDARDAAAAARFAEFGFGDPAKGRPDQWKAAKTSVVTETGDFKVMVSKNDLADAQKLAAGEKLTWAKDGKHKDVKGGKAVEVEHKAGDRRPASAVARLLANNQNAIVNSKTEKVGFDAIDIGDNKAKLAYIKADTFIQNAEASKYPEAASAALKESLLYTRKALGRMEQQRYQEWKKSQQASTGQER